MSREPDPPDPLAMRSALMIRFFTRVMERHMAASFHGVRVAHPGIPILPSGVPAIIYCNHPSWWDAALLIVLAGRAFPDRISVGPMDAAAMRKYPFMARIGLFPVEPETAAGAVAFMRVALSVLARPDALLWITAAGRFTDVRQRPVVLRGGVAHLVARLPTATVVPLALEFPFWDERPPEALARFGAPIEKTPDMDRSPTEWHGLLERRLEATMDALAVAAMGRDPAAFRTLVHGKVGVGGAYDVWRRAKAWAGGRRFDPAHGSGGDPGGRP